MTPGGWLRDPRYDAGLQRLAELQRQESALFAARARELALLASRTTREGWQAEAPFESLLLDVAGTCALGQVAAGSRLLDSEHLVLRLPGTLDQLEAGVLAVHQGAVLVEQTRELTPAVCAEVERRVLPAAPPLPPADLRRLVRRVVLEVDADEQARREARARAGRRVGVGAAEDGMALLWALVPAEQAQQAFRSLTEHARRARAAGDARGTDALRADLLVERLADPAPVGAAARPRPVQVVVHVPLAVALGVSEAPGELEGHGPISAAHARRLLPDADLLRACVDPDSGQVWAVDPGTRRDRARPRAPRSAPQLRADLLDLADLPAPAPLPAEPLHDPSAPLARLVRARDVRCDGIGCSVPARRCELDHDVPWPDGSTSAANLVSRSQRCHHAKHAGWTAARGAQGTRWTSPGGRTYLVPPRGPHPPPPPGRDGWRQLADAPAPVPGDAGVTQA